MELNNGTEEKEQFRKREAAIKLLADGLRGDWGDHHPVYGNLAGGEYLTLLDEAVRLPYNRSTI
jgi:hypothetical protein